MNMNNKQSESFSDFTRAIVLMQIHIGLHAACVSPYNTCIFRFRFSFSDAIHANMPNKWHRRHNFILGPKNVCAPTQARGCMKIRSIKSLSIASLSLTLALPPGSSENKKPKKRLRKIETKCHHIYAEMSCGYNLFVFVFFQPEHWTTIRGSGNNR